MNSILECRNLEKSYDGGRTKALKGISLSLGRGRIIGLLGPNGSGKTTFIKLLSGLLTPDGGELYIGGYPVGVETKRMISYLPEVTYCNRQETAPQVFPNQAPASALESDFYIRKPSALPPCMLRHSCLL